MKIALRIEPIWGSKLDYNYNYHTYCFINNLSDILHQEKKVGKFTFTFNFGKRTLFRDNIELHPNDKNVLFISSTDEKFIKDIGNSVNINKIYTIGNFKFKVIDQQIEKVDYKGYKLFEFKLLSPMVVRNGKKCLNPDEEGYLDSLYYNIKKKIGDNNVQIVLHDNRVKKKRIKIKNNTYVTGHLFDFSVKIDDDSVAHKLIEDGFGSLNTQGFGFVKIKKAIKI